MRFFRAGLIPGSHLSSTELAHGPLDRLLGTDGLAIFRWPKPAITSRIKSTIGYRIRPGKHDVTTDDWDAYMDFADHHFKIQKTF